MSFGYFLNTKKVTPSADFVISPAKAGAFLFFHTRLPLSPRPLLPFGRISPAAKPGWPVTGPTGAAILPFPSRLRRAGAPTAKTRRLLPFGRISLRETARPVIGPTFWVCRAKSGAAFRCAKPPCAVVRFAAMASPPRTGILPSPSRLCRAGSPTAKTRPLLPFGRISLRETGLAGRCPRRGQRARYPIFALLKCGPALAPRRSSAYASVSPAAKPRVRSSASPFGFAAQNQARHFAARNHPVRLSASRP